MALSGQRTEQIGSDQSDAPNDAANPKPAARQFPAFPISLYEVRVVRSLAGAPAEGSTVVLEQPGGATTRADGSRVYVRLEGDEPVEVGATYLFFANVNAEGNMTSSPFGRFAVSADGSLTPLKAWETLPVARELANRTLEEAAGDIEAAAQ